MLLGARVQTVYANLVSRFGSELAVLTDVPSSDIAAASNDRVAEGVSRVRSGDISIEPGYDGRYGTVSIWAGAGGVSRSPS